MSKSIFITGIGTDVGKTYVTALIVKYLKDLGYNSGYYKAAVSGNERVNGELVAGDAKYVKEIANLSDNANEMVSYIYEEAISPHLAAIMENKPVEIEKIKEDFKKVCSKNDFVTVEGSGGILCPIRYDNKKVWLEDIIKELNLSTIIVANAKLGSINATGLTVSYLKSKNIPIKGIILNNFDENDFMEKDNKKMIEELTGVKILACVKDNAKTIEIKGLENLYE